VVKIAQRTPPPPQQMNKQDLIQKVKALDGISQDERAYLIDLINTKKKYGLVWEDKPEDVEEQLRTHLPVLQEVVEKRISPPTLRGSDPRGGATDSPLLINTPKKIILQPSLFEVEKETVPAIDSEQATLPLGVRGRAVKF